MEELYKLAKEQGYISPNGERISSSLFDDEYERKKEILSIHSWLMSKGYCPLVGGVKKNSNFGLQWTIEFYELCKWSSHDNEENWHNCGFKFALGTYEDAMIDALTNAIITMKRKNEDPDYLVKALAKTKFVQPDIND